MLAELRSRLAPRLARLYPRTEADQCLGRLLALAEKYASRTAEHRPLWSERDIVLITYGDIVQAPGAPPLEALDRFLERHGLRDCVSGVHLLPFFPYSSDDGFSVIDYYAVDPELGDWPDVERLGQSHRLMFDLVLNHVSSQSEWFRAFLEGREPYTGFFHAVDPTADLSEVVRPRSSPLLTKYDTARGPRHVWTTFSADQIDLNFGSPEALVAMIEVLLFYVERGASIIRLDAIAYLWKRIGTSCIHLPETHEVVKLMRDVLDVVAPGTIILTETNVPHQENISYFGDGDEAHMVYQFSLAPLVLDALTTGDPGPLTAWARTISDVRPGTTYFEFTASHDGVGVRPLQGLVSDERFDRLAQAMRDRGGLVSMRRQPDGTESPYELNISYVSALGGPDVDATLHERRFLTSQAIMLALRGIPGVYFHSLVGTPNDSEGVERTGRARSINRKKYQESELDTALTTAGSPQRRIFEAYRSMLERRVQQPAFHPDGPQEVLDLGAAPLFGFRRSATDGSQQITVLTNVSASDQPIPRPVLDEVRGSLDLLTQTNAADSGMLPAYATVWLTK